MKIIVNELNHIRESIYGSSQLNLFYKNYFNFNGYISLDISISGVPIDLNKIPKSVFEIKFNYNFENLPYEIPLHIRSIYFYEYYELLEDLPLTLEKIIINKGFNHPVNKLSNNLKYIDFGMDFNQEVNDLPTSLEKIIFGLNFTHQINNLPSNVKFIKISNPKYDLSTILKLPESIISLELAIDEINENKIKKIEFMNVGKKYYIEEKLNLKKIYFY